MAALSKMAVGGVCASHLHLAMVGVVTVLIGAKDVGTEGEAGVSAGVTVSSKANCGWGLTKFT